MSASEEELKKLNELTDLYFKVKALGLGYYSYCPHCNGPVRWHWNKATTGKVYCQNKCPEGRFLMDLDDCQMIKEEEI